MAEKIELILEAQDKMTKTLEDVNVKLNAIKGTSIKTSKDMDNLASSVFKGVASWDLLKTAVTKSIQYLTEASKAALSYANAVDTVTDITGVSAETASEWVVQAQHVGTSAETVADGMATLAKNVLTNQKAFDTFGIKTKDTSGNLLSLDDILAQVRKREKELGKGITATTMEMTLFGKSGKELHDFLSADNKEMAKVVQTAKELGLILDNLTKDKMEQQNRKLNDMKLVQQAVGKNLNEVLIPLQIRFMEAISNVGTSTLNERLVRVSVFGGAAAKEEISVSAASGWFS